MQFQAKDQSWNILDESVTVMYATYEHGCGRAAYYSRMVFTAGKHDPNSPVWLASLTVISCATEYRTTTGLVEVSVEPEVSSPTGQTITVHHYTHIFPSESEPERLGTGAAVIEWMMLSPMVFKVGQEWQSRVWDHCFGTRPERTPDGLLGSGSTDQCHLARVWHDIRDCSGHHRVFPACYSCHGHRRDSLTRLFAVERFVYAVVSLLMVVLALSAWVAFYISRMGSILSEEPEGLLAMAAFLEGDDVIALVKKTRQMPEYNGGGQGIGHQVA
jgi:hypothetical protein